MKIYTKTGDHGKTSLLGGKRVDKDDCRIETNGQIDELNAVLGVVKASQDDVLVKAEIDRLQRALMAVMGVVAGGKLSPKADLPGLTAMMEEAIDARQTGGAFGFQIPGNSLANAFLHVARTKARTAERSMWAMSRMYPLDGDVMRFMNRMSDYLFALTV